MGNEEQLPDHSPILTFVIPGHPTTKKTSQRIVRMGRSMRLLPSQRYLDYEAHCKPFCEAVWKDQGKAPMDFGIGVRITVTTKNWIIGDVNGYQQAIGDILQKHGVIADDIWITWMNDGLPTINHPDKNNPRIEIEIRRFRHVKEYFREEKMKKIKKVCRKAGVPDVETEENNTGQ